MQQRVVGIRLVTGLIVAGGLLAGSLSPALAVPTELAGAGAAIAARFEPCTEGSNPKKCDPIKPEDPSKRGGRPKKEPRGGGINPPPSPPEPPAPPRGGRIPNPPRDDDDSPTVAVSTGGDSEPFVARHQPIPDMSDGVFLQVKKPKKVVHAPKPVVYAPKPVTPAPKPVVVVPPDAGIGPELATNPAASGAVAALAAVFGAGALFMRRRPTGDRAERSAAERSAAEHTFETFTKALATEGPRRGFLGLIAGGALGTMLGFSPVEADARRRAARRKRAKQRRNRCKGVNRICEPFEAGKCCSRRCCPALGRRARRVSVCAPRRNVQCCPAALGGGYCDREFYRKCCPPTPTSPNGTCCPSAESSCCQPNSVQARDYCCPPGSHCCNEHQGCCADSVTAAAGFGANSVPAPQAARRRSG